MSDTGARTGTEQRRSERVDFDGRVTVEFPANTLHGTGENLSDQGVYLRAEGDVPVRVRIGEDDWREGSLVRIETIGDGSVGIAIRFADPA